MTTSTNIKPTTLHADVCLGGIPAEIRRIGNWTPDPDHWDNAPFVAIKVCANFTVISHVPEDLEQLAYTIVEAADALRTIQHAQQHNRGVRSGVSA